LQKVEGVWPGKLEYELGIPTKGVAFGTTIRVDFKLIPLTKGVEIGTITSELAEIRFLQWTRYYCMKQRIHRVIVRDNWVLPEDTEMVEIEGQYGYRFQRSIQIPTSLNRCVQFVHTRGIIVKHMLNFTLRL
jgi:hypothetical protein